MYHLSLPITEEEVRLLGFELRRMACEFNSQFLKTSCAFGREVIGFSDRGRQQAF